MTCSGWFAFTVTDSFDVYWREGEERDEMESAGIFTNDLQCAPANPFHLVRITDPDSLLFQIEPSRTLINISFSS